VRGQHDLDEERQRRIDLAADNRAPTFNDRFLPWFYSGMFFIALIYWYVKFGWRAPVLAVCLLGGLVGVGRGIVLLQDRFNSETCEAERAYNRRRTRQGYAWIAGAGLAWMVVVILWWTLR
jgi:hypothetical protein